MQAIGVVTGALCSLVLMVAAMRLPELAVVARDAALVIGLRFAGALARYGLIVGYYRGHGDALRYHEEAGYLRDSALQWDWSGWLDTQWSGTHAIELANAVVGLPALGSVIGEFFIFAALGFVGLCLCVAALRRSVPQLPGRPLALVILCWPSLVFWPSSIGKEAVILLAIGGMALAVAPPRRSWAAILSSLLLAFAIRPHVAGLLAVSLFAFDTISTQRKTSVTVTRLAVSLAVSLAFVWQGATALGVDPTEIDTIAEELQYRSSNTDRGGSSMGTKVVGIAAIPLGILNVLFRPLPFEANGPTMLIAAVENLVFWGAIWRFRRGVRQVVKNWRRISFLRFGVFFGTLWAALIGVTFVNMGILARQRTLMMPFLVGLLAIAVSLAARDKLRSRLTKVSRFKTTRSRSRNLDGLFHGAVQRQG